MYDYTMIHGRFQPFHLGHFDYLEQAMMLTAKRLVIGVTNPCPVLVAVETNDDHRHLKSANPYTYFERYEMIQESILSSATLSKHRDKIRIAPFPIHNQDLWRFLIPESVVQVMSVLEAWDVEKKRRFQDYGFNVHELSCKRITSGTAVRRAIECRQHIATMVPAGTLTVLRQLGVTDG